MLTDFQSYAALRIGLRKCSNPREKIRLISQFIDCLERDYLSAYPDERPIFKDGMEKEMERHLWEPDAL